MTFRAKASSLVLIAVSLAVSVSLTSEAQSQTPQPGLKANREQLNSKSTGPASTSSIVPMAIISGKG